MKGQLSLEREELKPCPMCKGEGVVWIPGSVERTEAVPCWRCDGKGEVGEYDPKTAAIPF